MIVNAYDAWNAMLRDRADAHGFTCVDIYHAFDGPPGTRATGDLTVDGAHPKQGGNDLIAAMLAKVDVSTFRILADIEQVFVARPTGVGRASATYEIPIEGRDEWVAAARRLA